MSLEMGSDALIYIELWFSRSEFIAENYGYRSHKVLLVIQAKGTRFERSSVRSTITLNSLIAWIIELNTDCVETVEKGT
jgi:hypothetical protein